MVPRLVGAVAVVLWQLTSALNVDVHAKPGQVVQPEIVVPGEWLMDQREQFLFLPLSVPADVPMSQCKVMSNGDSLLVVVTEHPQEEPETNALRKYKLVIEAIKREAGHDETLLQTKLGTWYDTEDDDEVKAHIKAAMDSLADIQHTKRTASAKTVSVSLGLMQPASVASSVLQLGESEATPQNTSKAEKLEVISDALETAASDTFAILDAADAAAAAKKQAKPSEVKVSSPSAPARALPALLRGSTAQVQHHHAARVIKESFAVEVPYPVPMEKIVLLKTSSTTLMVAMPLVRKSLEANGISTGGKAFNRVPVFDNAGKWMAGPKKDLVTAIPGLDLATTISQASLAPLSD